MIYYFSTQTCAPCRMFKPVVQQVAARTGANVQYVDAQLQTDLQQKYSVTSVPTIVVEQNGVVVFRNTGVMSEARVFELFSTYK